MNRLVAIGALSGVLIAPQVSQPTLGTVIQQASAYAADFKRQISGIVTEETYVQDIEVLGAVRLRPEVTHRELKSDLLLVRSAETGGYVEFRDVAELDGRPVRDRQERLTKLFLDQKEGSAQLRQIIEESARYNIGKVRRNVNTPLLALLFFDVNYRSRFNFTRAADRTPALAARTSTRAGMPGPSPAFVVSTEVWVIDYEESRRPTIVQTPEGKDMPAHGRFWIDPASGRLLMTELVAGDADLRATINVSYQSEPLLGFSVPVEMREQYDAPNLRITGTATYGNFRRFGVTVEESGAKRR